MKINIKNVRKLLFNPGPATTTDSVKISQVVPDICPRENEFKDVTASIRKDLLKVVHTNESNSLAVLIGGSGTAAMEATIGSVLNDKSSLLIIINGAYGKRMNDIAKVYSIKSVCLEYKWGEKINFNDVENILINNKSITHIAMVHHETTTGILNSIQKFSLLGKKYNKKLILDAISSYAGMEIDLNETPIDYLMSTSNKCLQGMAGIGFVICNKKAIKQLNSYVPKSYYLNLYDEYICNKNTGESRFTPPVQVLYALRCAIDEFFEEGLDNRYLRYKDNMIIMRKGLLKLGFKFLLGEKDESMILLTLIEPTNPKFNFQEMHDFLYTNGITIYPGKISHDNTFRYK